MEHFLVFNAWSTMIVGIWFASSLATIFTRKSQPMGYALVATIVIGLGYFLIRLK